MKNYKLKVFTESEEKKKGLKGVNFIPNNELYLFPDTNNITMKGMNISLKLIFLNKDAKPIDIRLAYPNKDYNNPEAVAVIECSPFFNTMNLPELHEKIIKAIRK